MSLLLVEDASQYRDVSAVYFANAAWRLRRKARIVSIVACVCAHEERREHCVATLLAQGNDVRDWPER
jgi:hypothetical protein